MTTRPGSNSLRRATPAVHFLPALAGGTLLAALLLGGCSSSEIRITPPDDQPASMVLFVEIPQDQVVNSIHAGPSFTVRVEDTNGDVLNITDARIAVDQVEFGRTSGPCVDSTTSDDGDACNEAFTSPTGIQLPVDQGEVQLTSPRGVEPGTYDRLEVDLYRATQQDPNLIVQAGFQVGSSVRVSGSFTPAGQSAGQPVSVQFGPEASLQLPLGGEFPLEEGEPGAMTLRVDVESWFRSDGGGLIDPREAAEDDALRAVVEQNIIESFSATPGSPDPDS